MAKPRIFVSSTYYDLKHVRSSLEVFIETLGFEPVLAEYGSVAYDPSQPLDESCYREAQSSDIFVLIIGGRYGSIASSQNDNSARLEEQLESVTRTEFTRAHDNDIPVFILIEQGVYSEYQTYLRNKENSSIEYAHVDSANVFRFIEFIHAKQKNNPIHPFEKGADIEEWLKEQWAGIFQELLRQRKDNSRFADLASQIRQLEAVNSTLKSYLESVLQSVSSADSGALIERENAKLSRTQIVERARSNTWFDHVRIFSQLPAEQILDLHLKIETINDIIPSLEELIADKTKVCRIIEPLEDIEEARRDFSRLRDILGQKPVRFTSKFVSSLSRYIKENKRKPKISDSELA